MNYRIIRENNKYNKYMKWHLVGTVNNIDVFSQWYRTEKEATKSIRRFKTAKNRVIQ